MRERTIKRLRRGISAAKIARLKDGEPCTMVFTDIAGIFHTVAISNDAIALCLQLRSGRALMVEECSDFVSAHLGEIATAAAKSLASRGTIDGRVLLVAGDL